MEIVLLWCFVLAWMGKRGAEDLVHAVKGTPNPRYELKKAKAEAAGQRPAQQPRYGGREWFADLYSDALAAHTEKRRKAAAAKAQPVDDMVGLTRESKQQPDWPAVYDPNNARNCPDCKGEVVLDGRPCPRCLAVQQRRNAEREAEHGRWGDRPLAPESAVVHDDGTFIPGHPDSHKEEAWPHLDEPWPPTPSADSRVGTPCSSRNPSVEPRSPYVDYADERFTCSGCGEVRYPAGRKEIPGRGTFCLYCQHNGTADAPTAQIIQFPNPKNIEKEITMANSEITGLSTAIAFADQASNAHTSFATSGAEGYVGALEQGGNSGEVIGTAREAMEASGIAADKWAAHRAKLEEQLNLKEAHQAQPDAGDKQFLLNG